MLAAVRKLRLGVFGLALAGGMALSGAAPGAAVAKLVTSDTVAFKATAVNSAGEWETGACKVKSDTEKTVFPCGVVGKALGVGSPAVEVSSHWASADGEGIFGPLTAARSVKSKPPVEIYEGSGACEEAEESDLPGTKGRIQYPCVVTIKLTFNTKTGVLVGKYVVKEESTLP